MMGVKGSKPPHGNPGRYNNHGCGCDLCRKGWADHRREKGYATAYDRRRGVRPLYVYLAEVVVPHGTASRYRGGCRCDECRAAGTEARRQRRQRAAS